jgi:nitric oxide reductase NorD protein
MRLPRLLRNRAIGLSRRAFAPIVAWRASRAEVSVSLASVRRRLELSLVAMYAQPMAVGASQSRATADASGAPDIELPDSLDASSGVTEAIERYRVLAIEQAERIVRGTPATHPDDLLVRDLFLIAEGAAVDRAIVQRAPGIEAALAAARQRELTARPAGNDLGELARDVEAMVRRVLTTAPLDDAGVPCAATPEESLAWATGEANRLRAMRPHARYAGIRPIRLWQTRVAMSPLLTLLAMPSPPAERGKRKAATTSEQSGEAGEAGGDSEGEAREDGTGALTDTPGAPSAEAREGDEAESAVSASSEPARYVDRPAPGGIQYREWDEYKNRYRPDEVTVHVSVAREGADTWAIDTLRTHAPLVRQIRARFAPLRAHRTRLRAQRSGDELDLDACVAALVEIRSGRVPDDRLYRLTKPARRTLAIALLVDVSGSTGASLDDGRTVLDVERMTLLLASEALDELGDPYAVLSFSSSGRHDVQVQTVKGFTEHDPPAVRRRISALSAGRNTRLGAALRHASALLGAQPAERRLLLLLSDGQPNDIFGYQGSYAVSDSRRAVLEARATGVHTFCLTVDREEHDYLPHLFGVNGYRILRDPGHLPTALLQAVTQLLPQ